MPRQYYVATKGCSMGLQKHLMLAVDEKGIISFHRGHTDDKFTLDENGRPSYTAHGYDPGYQITGPLTKEQFERLTGNHEIEWGDFTKPGRAHSVRPASRAFGGNR